MPIPDIRLNQLRIRDVSIPEVPRWMSSDPPVAVPVMPPVTMELRELLLSIFLGVLRHTRTVIGIQI